MSLILLISIFASGLSIVFGLVTRLLLCYAIRQGDYHDENNNGVFGFMLGWNSCWWGRMQKRAKENAAAMTISVVPQIAMTAANAIVGGEAPRKSSTRKSWSRTRTASKN